MSTPTTTTTEHKLPGVPGGVAPGGATSALDASREERRQRRRSTLRRTGVQLFSVAVFLAVWWLVTLLEIWPEITVPKPGSVWEAFITSLSLHDKTTLNPDGIRGYSGHYLYEHLWASLWRIIQGVGWGIAFGVPLGLMLSVSKGVVHRYTTKDSSVLALDGIDLTFEPGEFVCLVGPSGCGKTTLLKLLAGFQTPSEGRVTVGGQPVEAPKPDRGVVFQSPTLYPWMDVMANVEFGPRMRRVDKAERRARAEEYLELVGLSDVMHLRPYELSGGMQQRCQIARVLANEPSIMLMDEPFGALDALTRERLQIELLRIWRETGKTIMFITHAVEEAIFLGSRVLVMSARPGRIVFDEPVAFAAEKDESADVRTQPDFVALRERVSEQIYRTSGVFDSVGADAGAGGAGAEREPVR